MNIKIAAGAPRDLSYKVRNRLDNPAQCIRIQKMHETDESEYLLNNSFRPHLTCK